MMNYAKVVLIHKGAEVMWFAIHSEQRRPMRWFMDIMQSTASDAMYTRLWPEWDKIEIIYRGQKAWHKRGV